MAGNCMVSDKSLNQIFSKTGQRVSCGGRSFLEDQGEGAAGADSEQICGIPQDDRRISFADGQLRSVGRIRQKFVVAIQFNSRQDALAKLNCFQLHYVASRHV